MNRDTICVQGGYTPGNGEPRQIPIIQSTTFKYDTSEDMGKLFDLEADGYFYSRLQNPTCDAVARKIAALEGGAAAMLTSSGQAANFLALFNICQCGDHIVSSSTIYGGTFNLISVTMAKMGIDLPHRHRGRAGRRVPAQHQGRLWRDHRQPRPHRAGHRKVCQGRPRPRGAPDRGQHLPHSGQLPPHRVGRRHRHPLHHQVYGRPRRRGGRRHPPRPPPS